MRTRPSRPASLRLVPLVLASHAALFLPQVARASSGYAPRAPHGAADCAATLKASLPGARVTAAQVVQPGAAARAQGQRPHCKVEATVDQETHIVALLPDEWNGRFVMGGGGGFVGAVDNQFAETVNAGYATVGTDAGHTAHALTAGWALHNERRVADFGFRAVHRTAEVTKALIAAYYGRPPERSYFIGCSNGGRQGLMEAQRYPADFDGIVSIAPAYNFLEIATSFVRNLQAQYPTGDYAAPVLTPAVLTLVATKVNEACDATDGVRDGTLEDPESCGFRVSALPACPRDVAAEGCVTRAQRAALGTITSPMVAGGMRYPGQPLGNEADAGAWDAWITGPVDMALQATGRGAPTIQGGFGTEFMKYLVYGDSSWRYVGYDLARAAKDGAKVAAQLSATNTDLSAFRARGGKLVLAHGWSDPALNARSTIEYFKAVQARTPHAASFTRLFMMPGVLHCQGGSGCDQVDWASLIRRWVEQGEAPARVLASKRDGAKVVRTRPLCAWPQVARYTGIGSTDDAANFACR